MQEIKNFCKVSSQISANLQNDWTEKIGDILTSLLPAGSITGTPKRKKQLKFRKT